MKAHYRKYNDHTHSSLTYHKKDGTPIRTILKEELRKEILELHPEMVAPVEPIEKSE